MISHSEELVKTLSELAWTLRIDVVDMIPVRRQNLAMKLEVLRVVGRWLASGPTSQA